MAGCGARQAKYARSASAHDSGVLKTATEASLSKRDDCRRPASETPLPACSMPWPTRRSGSRRGRVGIATRSRRRRRRRRSRRVRSTRREGAERLGVGSGQREVDQWRVRDDDASLREPFDDRRPRTFRRDAAQSEIVDHKRPPPPVVVMTLMRLRAGGLRPITSGGISISVSIISTRITELSRRKARPRRCSRRWRRCAMPRVDCRRRCVRADTQSAACPRGTHDAPSPKTAGVANGFDEQQDGVGVRIVDQEFAEFANPQVGLVSDRDHLRQPEPAILRARQEGSRAGCRFATAAKSGRRPIAMLPAPRWPTARPCRWR